MSTSSKDTANTFKNTLNLPQTPFSMRANLSQKEPERLAQWESENLYQAIQSRTQHEPLFSFHDGPPYANGDIHIGHLLNKVLKDFVVRSQIRMGKQCPYTPGWDCHGLPIEHKVMSDILNKKADKIASLPINTQRMIIRKACQEYAQKYIQLQSSQMKRLLTLADYNAPYLTMNPKFESSVLTVFAQLVKEKLVYRQLKPIHWSIANQTALAEAELEYIDRVDPAVYVGFACTDSQTLCQKLGIDPAPINFTIWTTTPWTLPANLAIAIHPDYTYAVVSYRDRYLVVASARIAPLEAQLNVSLPALTTLPGKSLLNLTYQHPFINRSGRIVGATYVTLDDGTGLVHTAPGHGTDDYITGLNENLPPYCPVKGDGTYDDTAPEWLRGKQIWDSNPEILAVLTQSGHLLHSVDYTHSYPHDWRSKTPVIFRSTEQWFVGVDQPTKPLRDMALASINDDIEFIPQWGKKRLHGMMASRPDWCISRQRAWGLPIPAFMNGDTPFLTDASVRAVARVFETNGSDAWFTMDVPTLLQHYTPEDDPDCPDNIDLNQLEKLYDIFDVWFESGSSWHSVMAAQDHPIPVDLYLEGSDQHRGWFHLSLLLGLGVQDKPPYKQLLTHGFIVDKNGRKMSKSTGNAIQVSDILAQYGAEVLRFWVSTLSFENDIKVDTSYFDTASDSYRKIRNTIRFLLSNLFDYTGPKTHDELAPQLQTLSPYSIDSWVLNELAQLTRTVVSAYTNYQFKDAQIALYQFCNETLSAIYCATVKDRLYCDAPHSTRRIHTQLTLAKLVLSLTDLFSPLLPHTSQEARTAFDPTLQSADFHSQPVDVFPHPCQKEWADIMAIRPRVLKHIETEKSEGLDNPLDCEVVLPDTPSWHVFQDDLRDLFGVSRVTFRGTEITINDLREYPRCERSWRRDETVACRANGSFLSDRDALALGIYTDVTSQ